MQRQRLPFRSDYGRLLVIEKRFALIGITAQSFGQIPSSRITSTTAVILIVPERDKAGQRSSLITLQPLCLGFSAITRNFPTGIQFPQIIYKYRPLINFSPKPFTFQIGPSPHILSASSSLPSSLPFPMEVLIQIWSHLSLVFFPSLEDSSWLGHLLYLLLVCKSQKKLLGWLSQRQEVYL